MGNVGSATKRFMSQEKEKEVEQPHGGVRGGHDTSRMQSSCRGNCQFAPKPDRHARDGPSMKPGDKGPKGSRRNSGRSIKRTRLSVVTQAKVGSHSDMLNPATDEEEIGMSTHPAFRRNTGRHVFKVVE